MNWMKDGDRSEFKQALEHLPENYRESARLILKYYDGFEEMCRNGPLTEAEREEYMEDAIRKNDTMMILLLCMERRVNSGSEC